MCLSAVYSIVNDAMLCLKPPFALGAQVNKETIRTGCPFRADGPSGKLLHQSNFALVFSVVGWIIGKVNHVATVELYIPSDQLCVELGL
jgi:hypothetical protein